MKFYRVHTSCEGGNSGGFQWFTSNREAEAYAAQFRRDDPDEWANVNAIDITPTKTGILDALNRFANHADNG